MDVLRPKNVQVTVRRSVQRAQWAKGGELRGLAGARSCGAGKQTMGRTWDYDFFF